MGPSAGLTSWRLGFEASPILLTRGIAAKWPSGAIPIIVFTESTNFAVNLLNGNFPSIDQLFAHWTVIPGTELIRNSLGAYPFANQVVAANAIIKEPLNISMVMDCPVQEAGGFFTKIATISALKTTLDFHSQNGGTYTVATPSYIFTDCILTNVRDVTGGDGKQQQVSWQFDFIQPLIANPTTNAQGSLMDKISGGLPITGELSWSSAAGNIGSSLSQFVSGIPGVQGLIGAASGGGVPF